MASLNRIVLIGRLTRDPDVKTSATGLSIASFSIAVDRRFSSKDGEKETDFFRIKTFKQTAEFVGNYLTKGALVAVEGRLQQNNWVDKEGNKRYDMDIVADSVQSLERASQRDGERPANTSAQNPNDSEFEDDSYVENDPFSGE